MTEEINKGCEFQSDCIEYKDISYLKVMPICAIYELSIACHDKVNKCKYYKLYKQLKRLEFELKVTKADYEASEQENKDLKERQINWYNAEAQNYRSALEEIREIANENNFCASYACPPMFKIIDKINEVLGNECN